MTQQFLIQKGEIYSITIIGLGSLGGFVAETVSDVEVIRKITLIDYDQIEKRNLENTIYKSKDVGKLKTDVLAEIIRSKNKDIEIIKQVIKFEENDNVLPDSDLVLDCRDFTYNRKDLIDARLYISGRYLIVDCRKDVSYQKHYEGKYTTTLSKTDLRNASFIISVLIYNGVISSLIRDKSASKFDLDYLKQMIGQKTSDIVYGYEAGEERLVNLKENLFPILEINKRTDLDVNVCIGDRIVSMKTIPKGVLRTGNDIIVNLVSTINLPFSFSNYMVSLDKENGKIILIPETGAA